MSSATCTSLTCGQLQKLIEKVEELNRTQTEAISAINNLTNKLSEQHFESVRGSSSLVLPTYNAVRGSDQPTRSHGYINWNQSCYCLKNHLWMEASIFANYCERIEQRGDSQSIEEWETVSIHQTKRFPTPHLYININDPQVAIEILCVKHSKITAEERKEWKSAQFVRNFLDSVKSSMHTRSSFEEKYGLKWVDIPNKIK